jgi:hypothetical protein
MDPSLQKFFDLINNDSEIDYDKFNAIDVIKAIVYCIENKSEIGICYINKLNTVCAEISRKLIEKPNDQTLDLITTLYKLYSELISIKLWQAFFSTSMHSF